ncbi:MAG: sensor histidine kinase [Thermoleophilia bacterium]
MKKMHQIKWKLLATYLALAAVCLGIVIVVTRQLTISLYGRHMHNMEAGSMGSMMSQRMTETLNDAFRDALNDSLIWGGAVAVAVAVILSLIISRRITGPIHGMAEVTAKVAEGDYSRRVDVRSKDEIGALAESFNSMAESLEGAQRLRRELMANIAHELRTPLTSISGYMEGLVDGAVPATAETYNLVHREAGRLSRLVDDLQRLSRAESGQEKLDIMEVNVKAFLERVGNRLEPQFREKGVSLELVPFNGELALFADEDKLDQVLTNLLDNSLRHTDSGGAVSLAAEPRGEFVALTVSDNGAGIPEADLPHIFERFYTADKSRSRERGGTGIGLTIASSYAKALGGSISAESEAGTGTKMTVLLPSAA